MSFRWNNSIFSLLDQDGLFSTGPEPPTLAAFAGGHGRRWVSALQDEQLATRYRTIRNQIFEFLDVSSYFEIESLVGDAQRCRQISTRAYRMLGRMYGLSGSEREVHSRIDNYSSTADGVIRFLKQGVFSRYASFVEMSNEIDLIRNPVELLVIIFDSRYHQKVRFEAKRKLILMHLAASIDQRERETDIEGKFSEFLNFLNEHVWSSQARIGELSLAWLVSHHAAEDFSCSGVQVVPFESILPHNTPAASKLTLVKRRKFVSNGREVPIYVSIRKKPPEAKVLKLLRKGEENPAVAVDDELGLMGVVDSVNDVKLFQKHLTASATRAGSFMTLEEISDTLSGGEHKSNNVGSSAATPMFKFFARMGGMRVEFILHTNRSYLDYMCRRGMSHDEYEIKRLIDAGVARLLFPAGIYRLDMDHVREELIRWARRRIEER